MNTVKISVIVPFYNGSLELFRECLDSLLNQTFQKFEILVIDDGSDEGPALELDKLSSGVDRITVIHKENRGVSSARNIGIALARGEVINFTDADDFVSPLMLENLWDIYQKEAVDIVTSYIKPVFNSNYKFLEKGTHHYEVYKENRDKGFIKKEILRGHSVSEKKLGYVSGGPCGLLVNTNLAKKCLFPEGVPFMEDVIWNYQIFTRAKGYAVAEDTLYAYRQNHNSATHRWELSIIDSRIHALKIIKNLIEEEDMFQWYALRVLSSYAIICKCCARTDEISGMNKRIKIALNCYKDDVWRIIEKRQISVNWDTKYRVKRWMAIHRLLPLAYLLQSIIG